MERELLLLGMLHGQDLPGYQLAEFVERNLDLCTDLNKATIYVLLERMARSGWISYEQIGKGRRPPKRIYHLTGSGEQAFQNLLRENLAAYLPQSFPGDAGLAFINLLPTKEVIMLLQQRRTEMLQHRLNLQTGRPRTAITGLLLDHHERHLQAELQWIDDLLAEMEVLPENIS